MKSLYLSLILTVIFNDGLMAQATWTQKSNFGGGGTSQATAFSIGNKAYVGGTLADLWEYDPVADSWSQKASFIGGSRGGSASFSIGTKGYLGTGGSFNDFYEYDQPTNTWTQKANFGGSGREGAIGFATSTKGYIGTGGNYMDDLWEYDPVADTWTQVASITGTRYHAAAFSINDKGYVYGGFNGSFLNDMWEYDPTSNIWTQMSTMPGPARDRPVGFSIGTKGYIGFGWDMNILSDFYEYDQPTNSWTTITNASVPGRYDAVGVAVGFKAYVGTGVGAPNMDDWWEYGNACSLTASTQNLSCASVCDGSATVTFPDPGAVLSYSWNTNPVQTSQTATGLCAQSYIVTTTDTTGCIGSIFVSISSPVAITATATATEPVCNGDNNGSLCGIASGGSGIYSAWLWSDGQTSVCATGLAAGTYTVTVTDDGACSGTSTVLLSQPAALLMSISHTNASCPACADGNATANITGGIGPYLFSWSNGVTNSAYLPNILPGTYSCCVTDSNGCSTCDSVVISSPSLAGSLDAINGVTIFPDPFTDYIRIISLVNAKEPVTCEIVDATGKLFYSAQLHQPLNEKISTSALEPGIYFVKLGSGNRQVIKKIIKH
jgi:N-acetylneuraminic acid mutarotase